MAIKEMNSAATIDLNVPRCQDTMIGGSFVRGVSGGERKRVCIGNEIIINPSLLFLDEPTSGLDSTTALRIVQMLQDIAAVFYFSSFNFWFSRYFNVHISAANLFQSNGRLGKQC